MLLNGITVDSVTGRTINISSPSTGEVIGSVPDASSEDVDLAVKAAKHAFESWSQVDLHDRRKLLFNAAAFVEKHEDSLALLAAEDNGSPVRYLKGYFKRAVEWLLYFANLSTELKGQTIPTPGNTLCYTIRQPYGVIGQMIPWNAPFVLLASHIAPALIAGNSVVLKLSELAPLADLEFARLICEMLPKGVLNVITGFGKTTGKALAAHPDISKLSFTGATSTGSEVMKLAAENVTPVIMELGGNNANIIFPDADIERAVQGAVSGMCLHLQGQSCYACTRLFVHEKIHDDFVTGFKKKLELIKVGLPTEESTEMGALISEERLSGVLSYVKDGINGGANLLTGGKRLKDKQVTKGYFMRPTVLTGVTKDMQFAHRSSFGPVACVFNWTDYEEMINQVNGVTHGLSASIWTTNLQQAHVTARKLKAGYVWINQNARIYTGVPFGGIGQSGFGKQICLEGLLNYSREKSIIVEV
jgi:betaine-aldehyde dehydrogenase